MRIVGTDDDAGHAPCYQSGYGVVEDYTINVLPAPSCMSVSAVSASSFTNTEATIVWTAGSTETEWAVEYKTAAETDWTAVTPNPTVAIVHLTGLDINTAYNVRVKAICSVSDESIWVSANFTTTPAIKQVPFTQDFESNYDEFVFISNVTNDAFVVGSATGNPGNSLYISNDGGITNAYSDSYANVYAVFYIQFGEGIAFNLSFDWKCLGELDYDYGGMFLLNQTDALPTSIPDAVRMHNEGTADWQTVNIALAGAEYANTIKKLVIMWRSDVSGTYTFPLAIDNISITELPCPPPTPKTTWATIQVDDATLGARTATVSWGENAEISEYVVEYKKNSEATWTVVTPNVTTNSYTFTGLTPSTAYDVRVKSHCSEGWESDYITRDYCFYTVASCPTVSSITASNITSTSMDIDWTVQGSETLWNIYVSATQVMDMSSIETPTYSGVTKPYSLTGLNPNTTYYVYVQADCGTEDGTSNYMGSYPPFTTSTIPQTPATLTYTPTLASNDGWDLMNSGQANKWYVGSAGDNSVTNALFVDNNNGAGNTYTNNAGQPTTSSRIYAFRTINFNEIGTATISFQWKNPATNSDDYIRAFLTPVGANLFGGEDNGLTGSTTIPAGWISLTDKLNNSSTYTIVNTEVPITATGDMNLVFYWHNDAEWGGGSMTNPAGSVKNISVQMTSCASPTALTVANIGLETADISWTAGASETAWNIIISETQITDFTDVTPTASVTSSSYQATELQAATVYYVYVQADCGGTDGVSNWISTTFNTPVCSPEDKSTYTFELLDDWANDDWMGSKIEIRQNGIKVAEVTKDVPVAGQAPAATQTITIDLCNCMTTELVWRPAASFASDCGFNFYDPEDNLLHARPIGFTSNVANGEVIYSFTTECPATPLAVVSTDPEDGEVDVPVDAVITVTLDGAVDTNGEPDWDGVTLTSADGSEVISVAFNGQTITITPDAELANGTEYTLTIPAGAIAGLDAEVTITFTTANIDGFGNAQTAEIRIYPTLTDGEVTIEAPTDSKVKVADITGRIVDNYDYVTFKQTIKINRAAGTYFVIVENDGVRKVQKVILK
jgi:hypothetical protein